MSETRVEMTLSMDRDNRQLHLMTDFKDVWKNKLKIRKS